MAKAQSGFGAAELRQWIIETVGKKPKTEKRALFGECLNKIGLSEEERKDKSSDSRYIRCKSLIGSVLSEMLREGLVELVDDYFFKLPDDVSAVELITEEKLEEVIISLMQREKTLTKKDIFGLCEKEFDKNGDGAERAVIHRRGGNVIARLVKNGVLVREQRGVFRISSDNKFPNTDLGNCLKEASKGGDVKKYFKKALNLKGGEFFEQFSVNLIGKELGGYGTITKSDVTGGADDNGIDGVIEFRDGLGFKERVLVQARTRAKGTINLKEVREFYGALISEKGTRGIFVTTASFHSEAAKFLNRHFNLIGLDGDGLYGLAVKHRTGVMTFKNRQELDYDAFLDADRP